MKYRASLLAMGAAALAALAAFWRPNIPSPATSADYAAWVQALGVIAAIVGTAGTGIWLQHRDREFAVKLLVLRRDQERIELVRRQLLALQTLASDSEIMLSLAQDNPERWLADTIAAMTENQKAIAALPIGDFQEWSIARFVVFAKRIHEQITTTVGIAHQKNEIEFLKGQFIALALVRLRSLAQSANKIREHVENGDRVPDCRKIYDSLVEKYKESLVSDKDSGPTG